MISFPSEMQIYCRFKHGCMRLDIIPSWMILCLCWERDSPVFFCCFFFSSYHSPSYSHHFNHWIWENNADESDRGVAVHERTKKRKKEKKRKAKQRTRNQSSKETSEGIAQFQDWSVRFLRQKRSLKVLIKNTQRCHITIVLSFFFKPIGSSLLEKKSTHANIMHAIKIHQDKTGYSSRAFN